MTSGLIIHAYNLKHGLKVTGYDEDDPMFESLNLPSSFASGATEIMTFRYKCDQVTGDIIMKIIPQDGSIDVNAMISTSDDEIHSAEIKISQFDFAQADKQLLDNLDSWADKEGEATKAIVTKKYITNVFEKLKPKKKEE